MTPPQADYRKCVSQKEDTTPECPKIDKLFPSWIHQLFSVSKLLLRIKQTLLGTLSHFEFVSFHEDVDLGSRRRRSLLTPKSTGSPVDVRNMVICD